MADLVISISIDASEIKNQTKEVESDLHKIGEAGKKSAKSLATPDYSEAIKQLKKVHETVGAIGSTNLSKTIQQVEQINAALRIDYNSPEFKARTAAFMKEIEVLKSKSAELANVSNNATESVQGAAESSGFSMTALAVAVGDSYSEIAQAIFSFYTQIATKAVELTKISIQMAGDLQEKTKTFISFAGSARLAGEEIAQINEIARNTEGLRLDSAEEGYENLRKISIEANQAQNFIKGFGDSGDALNGVVSLFKEAQNGSENIGKEIQKLLQETPVLQKSFYDAFGTLNSDEIQKFFDKDLDGAFKRLGDAAAKNKVEIGGYNDAIGKLQDEFLVAGREFGKPILQPLTRDIKELTGYLRDNQSEWKKLGTSVADFYNGLSLLSKNVSGGGVGSFLVQSFEKQLDYATNGIYSKLKQVGQLIEEYGEIERQFQEKKDTQKFFSDFGKDNSNLINNFAANNFTFDFSKPILTDKESSIRGLAEQQKVYQKLNADMEKLRQDEIALLRVYYDERISIIDSAQNREIALVESRLTNTLQEEIEVLRSRQLIQNRYFSEQLKSAQNFYSSQLATDGLSAQETTKIRLEGFQQLRRINDEIFLSEISTQKQIAEKMRQILDERRRDLIEFKSLQIREIKQGLDAQTNEIEKAISNFGNIADYSRLIQSTSEAYGKISQLTRQSFDLQLQNQSLTNEQRINLEKQKYLELQGLASEYGQKITQIENQQREAFVRNLSFQRDKISSYLQHTSSLVATFQDNFFSPEVFSNSSLDSFQRIVTQNGVRDLIEKDLTDTRKLFDENLKKWNEYKTLLNGITDIPAGQELLNSDERKTTWNIFDQNFDKYKSQITALESELTKLNDSIPRNYFEFEKLAIQIKGGNIEAFDQLSAAILKNRQALDMADAQSAVDYFQSLSELEKDAIKKGEYLFNLNKAQRNLERLGYDQTAESARQYSESLQGLRNRIIEIQNGDISGIKYLAEQSLLKEKINLLENIATLEQGYYKDSELWALQRRERLLTAERDIWEIRRQLSEKGVYSEIEANAKVLRHINDNLKSVTDSVADFKIRFFDGFSNALTSPFDALEKKLTNLPPIVKDVASAFLSLARDIIKAFSQKLILKLLGLDGSSSGIFGGSPSNANGGIFDSIKKLFNFGGRGSTSSSSSAGDSSFSGLIEQAKKLFNFGGGGNGGSIANQHEAIHSGGGGKLGLAGGLAIAGMGANIVGGLIGGRVGGVISGAGSGLAMGAQIGSLFGPGPGTAIGAAIGAIAGGLMGLLGGDPKRKIDKQENMPKLTQGFADALTALRALAADKNALYNNPNEVLAKAMEIRNSIASGFSIDFQSKKYREIAKLQINSKLAEADAIIKQIQGMGDEARQALEVDKRLETSFASGVYLRDSLSKFGQFKRRNGMLSGAFDALDTLPSMLSRGEMVLNPSQIQTVQQNAGFDVFKNAGIPNYASGTYVAPSAPFAAPSASVSASSPTVEKQPINITIVTENSGIVKSDIKDIFVDSLKDTNVQVKISKAAERGKSRTR